MSTKMHQIKREQAIRLRIQGKSYGEILKILNIPSKGSLSYWFRNLELPADAKKRLEQKIIIAQERGLFDFNRKRTKAIKEENASIHNAATKSIASISARELLLIGAALYWGEGCKKFSYPSLSLTNSDPQLIKLYMRFLREVLGVADQRVRTHIHVHPNVNIKEAIKFWSKVTMLPAENFRIVYQVSRLSRGRRPKNLLPHGTLDVRVHSRQLHFKVLGLIDGLAREA